MRSPGWRAAGGGGVDGCGPGIRLVPVLLEFFPDPALGGGELHGCGFFVLFVLFLLFLLFLLYALGPQGLSANGGPGGRRDGAAVFGSVVSGAVVQGEFLVSSCWFLVGILRQAQDRLVRRCSGIRHPGMLGGWALAMVIESGAWVSAGILDCSGTTISRSGGRLLVADDVYYALLGGGAPVVGLRQASVPERHDVEEGRDDGSAAGRIGLRMSLALRGIQAIRESTVGVESGLMVSGMAFPPPRERRSWPRLSTGRKSWGLHCMKRDRMRPHAVLGTDPGCSSLGRCVLSSSLAAAILWHGT